MLVLVLLTLTGVAALAFANGANDVSKGVATLAGSGRASYRGAIAWGAVWTFVGGLLSLTISAGLMDAFTSTIIVPDVLATPFFPLAVAGTAAVWIAAASITGLPVSTTHGLTGAIVGVALATGGAGSVRWGILLSIIAAPLAFSPLASAAVAYALHPMTRRLSPACVCVQPGISAVGIDAASTASGVLVPHVVARASGCAPASDWRLLPADVLHWGGAAAVAVARAINDNAKVAAVAVLAVSSSGAETSSIFLLTAFAMTAGSWAAGLRVTRTLGHHVVRMDHETGLAANLCAAGLVFGASFYSLPVSTTHVSTGAIVGAGLRSRGAIDWRCLGTIVVAWVGTVPLAAAVGGFVGWLLLSVAS